MDSNLICPQCAITLNLPDSPGSCCSSHLSLASTKTHTGSHRARVHSETILGGLLEETVTQTHMLDISRSGPCQEVTGCIRHCKDGAQEAAAARTPQPECCFRCMGAWPPQLNLCVCNNNRSFTQAQMKKNCISFKKKKLYFYVKIDLQLRGVYFLSVFCCLIFKFSAEINGAPPSPGFYIPPFWISSPL